MTSATMALRTGGGAATSGRSSWLQSALRWLVSIPALCGYVYLGVGLWLALGPRFYEIDAIARLANALYVIKSRDPHAAAVGFIWNPLPSIVQIPFIAVLDPFGLAYLAAPIHTALFGVGTLVLLDRIFRLVDVGRWTRRVLLLTYGLHPMVVYFAANGMSEVPFFFFMIAAIHQYLRWVRGNGWGALIQFSLFSAATFLVRYESIAFFAACCVALMIAFFAGKALDPDRLEAILLTYLVPISYVIALWAFFNWIFVGDPLYFYHAPGSNLAQTAGYSLAVSFPGVVGSVAGAAAYTAERWAILMPAVVPVTILALLRGILRRDHVALGLALVTLALPAFTAFMVFAGALFPFLRYFMYGIPLAILVMPFVLEPLQRSPRRYAAGWILSVILLLAAWPSSLYAMATPEFQDQSGIVGHFVAPTVFPVPDSFSAERAIAQYVDGNEGRTVVLVDSYSGFAIDVFARDHSRFAVSSDRDFKQILDRPDSGAVTHILVPAPGIPDAINDALPGFWDAGAPYATLVRDFGGAKRWRLYKIASAGVQ